ncbi:MAG TPA: protein kinase [Acidobacteriota bacterium]|mgnify:CR=1 FL=1|nr:protein kinase [Acidobacteriota bacterium]HQP75498.1 protein kinase [Acidobacteriota bacterium]
MIGQTVSHYRIIEKLGEGGMGVVYKAEDTTLQRTVALKFLPPELTRDAEAKQRFLHEARAAARLDHPNICTVYEVGESDGQLFLAMACYEGMTLREKLKAGPLPWAEAAALAMQAAAGLSEAHLHGIVHRDIKPANLFLTSKGQLKLLDFGLAKLTGASVLTKSGSTMGTAAYMSPEQVAGRAAEAQSDLWSLGVVLYEMVSGRTPFAGDYAQAVMYGILNEAPVPLEKLGIAAPAALQEILTKCLTKRPEERYASAEELGRALATCLGPEESAAALASLRSARVRRRWPASAAALVAVLAVAGIVAWRSGWWPFPASERAVRLAVLPLANLSGDPEQEYLSDGLTQELINQLGRLHPATLSVIARTSVMRYKKSDKGVDQIGRELGVDYILEGSAQREGGRIRVTAELIRVRDQAQLWADAFEREMAGVLVLQSNVARKVAGALALRLLPAEQARLANVRTVNPEAHEAYLQGSYHWMKLTPGDLDTAKRYFELALSKDPDCAPAYEGLARVWTARQGRGITLPELAGPNAKQAALRALALDDTSSEAHAALAMVKGEVDWDWAGADAEWKRALEIDPNSASAHAFYAMYLGIVGRLDEALLHVRRAIELDPFNARFHSYHAAVLYYNRRYEESLAAAGTALSLQPDDAGAEGVQKMVYIAKGMRDEQLAQQRKRIARDPERMAVFQQGLAEGGYEGAQRRIADLLAARYEKTGGVPEHTARRVYMPCTIGLRYMDARDYDRAMDWLEEAYKVRDPNVAALIRPLYDPLRANPRFQALARKLNLPWAQKR